MKSRLLKICLSLLLALAFAGPVLAENRTPGDNHIDATRRSVAYQQKEFAVTLTDATVSNVYLKVDTKSAVVVCPGDEAVNINVSYYDFTASTHSVGDLLTAGTDDRILTVHVGMIQNVAQNIEFTHVFLQLADSSGTTTCYITPGGGYTQ